MNAANMQSRDVTSVCCISWWLNIKHTSRSGPTQPLTQCYSAAKVTKLTKVVITSSG